MDEKKEEFEWLYHSEFFTLSDKRQKERYEKMMKKGYDDSDCEILYTQRDLDKKVIYLEWRFKKFKEKK